MKAIVVNKSGGVDELNVQMVAEPTTPEGYVKIRTKAFGLNRAEAYFRAGSWGEISEPKIPGIEAVGEVAEDNSGHFQPGDKVITAMGGLMLARDGSYAEYLLAPPSNVLAVKTTLSWQQLAAIPQAYLTIWAALDKNLAIQPGQTLLVRGGTTTLGFAAITYAKARGLRVIATTRSAQNETVLKLQGADIVVIDDGHIADKVRDIMPNGIDNALDVVGAATLKDTLAAVKCWGQVCVVGVLSGTRIDSFDFMSDLPNTVKLSFFGSGLLGSEGLEFSASPIQWVIEQIEKGNMPSLVSKTYRYDQIQDAHQAMENNQILGKGVVSF